MGVTDLWPILGNLCERRPLTYLSGKRVAVDLSCWVVQACSCKGLNAVKSPYLRNLFFRVTRLLQLGVFPIFVIDGKLISLKETAVKQRCAGRYSAKRSASNVTRSMFDRILRQCQDLLHTLGLPCIRSKGEGEAMCAFLYLKGIVDGVITEDNDAFLYGADVVFRDFSIDPCDAHVNVYDLKSPQNKLNLDRRKLVALALLLGCDYSKGVLGVGREKAMKFFEESKYDDILQRFEDWKKLPESELFPQLDNPCPKQAHCNRCGHSGSNMKHKKNGCSTCNSQFTCYLPTEVSKPCQCQWHLNAELVGKCKAELKIYNLVKNCSDFPDKKVVEEYLLFEDTIPSEEFLEWKHPSLASFQEKAFNFFNWTFETCIQKFLPIIVSWQLHQLNCAHKDPSQFVYRPSKILKHRTVQGEDYYEVCWTVINSAEGMPPDDLITLELSEYFSKCYSEIVTEFLNSQNEGREAKKQCKAGKKKEKIAEECKKVQPELFDCPKPVFSTDPEQSSLCGSLDSFLEIPLSQRIQSTPHVYSQKPISPGMKLHTSLDKENIPVYFNNESSECSIFPLSHNNMPLQIELKPEKSSKTGSETVPLKENDKGSNLSHSFIDLACDGLSQDLLCLTLNESGDRISCGLKPQVKNLKNSSFSEILNGEAMAHSTPDGTSFKLSDLSFSDGKRQRVSFAESPLAGDSKLKPCLIFSVNATPSSYERKRCIDHLFSEIVNGCSPDLSCEILSKNSCSSTP